MPLHETYAYSSSKVRLKYGFPIPISYTLIQAALHHLSRHFAGRLGWEGITSNTIACGRLLRLLINEISVLINYIPFQAHSKVKVSVPCLILSMKDGLIDFVLSDGSYARNNRRHSRCFHSPHTHRYSGGCCRYCSVPFQSRRGLCERCYHCFGRRIVGCNY